MNKTGTTQKTKNCRCCGVLLETVKHHGARCMVCYGIQTQQKRKDLKTQAVEYAGGKCGDCGGVFPDCVYDFHHVDGTKEACVGAMTHNCRPWEVIKGEVDKCEMLCANCHRLRHYK